MVIRKKFDSAAQFNEHAKREIIKNRALALLTRDPDKRRKYERTAEGYRKTMNLFNAPLEHC